MLLGFVAARQITLLPHPGSHQGLASLSSGDHKASAGAASLRNVPGSNEPQSNGSAMGVGRFMELGSGTDVQRTWNPRPITPPHYQKMAMGLDSKPGINTPENGMQLQPYQPKSGYARQVLVNKGPIQSSASLTLEPPAPQHPTSTGPPVINFPFLEVS